MWRWRSYEEVYWGRMALCHSGVKGQKKGVRRYQNLDGTYTELGKERRRLAYIKKSHIMKEKPTVIKIAGHQSAPLKNSPRTIMDHEGRSGKIDKRTYYDEKGRKAWEIHTTDHGNPKKHPYGLHGEHIHLFEWADDSNVSTETKRDLNEAERKENGDIL